MENYTVLIAVIAGVILLFVFLYFVPVNLWITAQFSNVRIGLLELVFMRIRKVPPSIIVKEMITARKAGLDVQTADLETHYLAGGHVPSVIKALISAPDKLPLLTKSSKSKSLKLVCILTDAKTIRVVRKISLSIIS